MPTEEPKAGDGFAESGLFQTASAEPAEALRERALAQAQKRGPEIPEDLIGLSPEAGQKLLHELRVHQIELELQNDELRRAQEELEVSRARYFDLYDLAPVGYVTVSEKGLVIEANLTAAGLFDVPRNALVKRAFSRFILPEDQDIYFMHGKELLLSGAPHSCELRLMKSHGEPFWARLEARVAQGDDGARVYRTVLSDITERKRAQQILGASEARHRVLFESSHDALMTLVPPRWEVTSANAATVAMFAARDEADLMSRTLWSRSPERQPDGRLSKEKAIAMLDVAMQVGFHRFEWTCVRNPAQEFRATVVLVRVEANGAPLIQATVRDETQSQKERAVLAQTERLASMGLLAASVGHEINNPLAYVLSNLESLAQVLPKLATVVERCRSLRSVVGEAKFTELVGEDAGLLEPAALKAAGDHAHDALDGAQRITRISRVLSAFARVDTPDLHKVDVAFAIESAIAMAFNEIRFRATLVRDFAHVPPVWASDGKLSQVFLNLLMNAVHAIEENHLEENCITVRLWAENGSVFSEVKDTGKGIAPEHLAQIFEPFFSTKRPGGGSGLGLSICRNIMTEFGGEIQVESELGGGTRFVVRLPILTEAPDPRLNEPVIDAVQPILRGRVLVVDDEERLRTVMKRLLVEHEVVTVSSGAEAQALLEHDQAFDLILCDLMMPDVSGVDVHRWLTARNPDLARRTVFVTGGAFGSAASEYLTSVGNLKIEKPFENHAFKHVVSERVREAKSEPPPGPGKLGRKQ